MTILPKKHHVSCDYCGKPAMLVTGDKLYARGDLWQKQFWTCTPCGAWVGCHPGTDVPLGRLADKSLRHAKMEAHAVFDPLWQEKAKRGMKRGQARRVAYAWLAKELGLPVEKTHIGLFDLETCTKVKELCWPYAAKLRGL